MMHSRSREIEPVFGSTNARACNEIDQVLAELHTLSGQKPTDILNPDTELRVSGAYEDAVIISRVMFPGGDEYKDAIPATYRAIIFSHMLLDRLYGGENIVTLNEYWETSHGLGEECLQQKMIDEASDFFSECHSLDDIIGCFMPEIDREGHNNFVADIAAGLVLRQAEVDTSIDALIENFRVRLQSSHINLS